MATCNADTDGDGVPDPADPDPTVPGDFTDVLSEATNALCSEIHELELNLFSGPNENAIKGRRNARANRACGAAIAITEGDIERAIERLDSLLAKIDGEQSPPDWMDESDGKTALAADVSLLIDLLQE